MTTGQVVKMKPHKNGRHSLRVMVAVLAGLAVIAVVVLGIGGFGRSSGLSHAEYTTVTIAPGDTLWSVAREIVGEKDDPRRMVYIIKQLNDIQAHELRPGMTLTVPAV